MRGNSACLASFDLSPRLATDLGRLGDFFSQRIALQVDPQDFPDILVLVLPHRSVIVTG